MTTDHHSPSPQRTDESKLGLLREVRWPDEQVAFRRAAQGLIEGERISGPPSPERLAEMLRMAGDLGLIMAHVPGSAHGPGHGLAASLLTSEAFAVSTAWSSIFEPTLIYGLDPLLLRPEPKEPEHKLLRSFGLGERAAMETSIIEAAGNEGNGGEDRPLALMRRLRNSFSRVGSTIALLDRTSLIFLRPPSRTRRPAGSFRARLASSVARMDLARLLSHNAGHRVDSLSAEPSSSEDPAAPLRTALLETDLLINLSDLSSWFALASAAALIEEAFGATEQELVRGLLGEARAHLELRRKLGMAGSLKAARELIERRGEHGDPLLLVGAPLDITFRESQLSAAAQQSASLVLSRMMEASMDARIETRHDCLALIMLALGLEIDSSNAVQTPPIECGPSTMVSIRSSSPQANRALELGVEMLRRVANTSTRDAEISDLRRVWRQGPLRRRLEGELLVVGDGAFSLPLSPSRSGQLVADPSDPGARREELRLAAEAGLFRPIRGIEPEERIEWLAASIGWSEAFARDAAGRGSFASSAIQSLDPLMLLGDGLPEDLRDGLSSGAVTIGESPISAEAFEAVSALPSEAKTHLLQGRIEEIAFLEASDLLLVPCLSSEGERLLHSLPWRTLGVEPRFMGNDPSGIPIHSIELRRVPVQASAGIIVSEEELDALLILRSLRDAFDFLALASALAPEPSNLDSSGIDAREDGDRHALDARLYNAGRLCLSAAFAIGDSFSKLSSLETRSALSASLMDRSLQVGIAKLAAWYAFQDSAKTSGTPVASSLLERLRSRFDERVLLAISRDLPEELSTGLDRGEVSADLRASRPAAAAHRLAMLVATRVPLQDLLHAADRDDDPALLFAAGPALDLAAGLGQPPLGPAAESAKTSLGLLSLPRVLLAAEKALRASLRGEDLDAALRALEAIERSL